MTDDKPKTGLPERQRRIAARQEHMKSLKPPRPTVHVEPANEQVRKFITHPKGGLRFPPTGPAEWPLDRFTRRRIADGSVKVANSEQAKPVEPADEHAPRHHSRRHAPPAGD